MKVFSFLSQNILLVELRSIEFSPSFPPILRAFVAHMRTSSSILLAVTASAEYIHNFALLPPFYSRLFLSFSAFTPNQSHLAFLWPSLSGCYASIPLYISFRLPFVHMCNALSSPFIIFSLRSFYFLSLSESMFILHRRRYREVHM